jgi:hypothetical protein
VLTAPSALATSPDVDFDAVLIEPDVRDDVSFARLHTYAFGFEVFREFLHVDPTLVEAPPVFRRHVDIYAFLSGGQIEQRFHFFTQQQMTKVLLGGVWIRRPECSCKQPSARLRSDIGV